MSKILYAYFSWGGSQENAFQEISKLIDVDKFLIEPKIPYSRNYDECLKQGKAQIDQDNFPELTTNVDLTPYEIVFIGSPNWFSTIAPPITSFVKNNNFGDQKILPIITHGTGGLANTVTDLKKLLPNTDFLPTLDATIVGSQGGYQDFFAKIGLL